MCLLYVEGQRFFDFVYTIAIFAEFDLVRSIYMAEDPSRCSDQETRTREFVRLLSLYEQELSGYIVSLVPNWADGDEIAQETKLRLWEQFERYDSAKDFGAWARTIAHFMVLAYRKRSKRTSARFSQQFIDLVRHPQSLCR